MNTAGLELFGSPERNTLRPLCVVLLAPQEVESLGVSSAESRVSLRELERAFVCSERLPFISQGRRVHGRWVPDRWTKSM